MELTQLLTLILPPIWAAIGPLVTAALTRLVNVTMDRYVPRPAQAIVSGVLGALAAGATGPSAGLDHATAMELGAGVGVIAQVLAAIQPKTLLTEARKD